MTQILGISGKKQAGKNVTANLIIGCYMVGLQIVREKFLINEKGQLWISDIFGDEDCQGIFDIYRDNSSMRAFLTEHLDPFIKLFSFADALKKNVCIDVLGLTHEQCYGTDEDKNTLTHLRWENMPGVISASVFGLSEAGFKISEDTGLYVHDNGQMTAREVMQYVGADIFRKMYPDVWVDATIRYINRCDPTLAVISDVRFPNEVEAIQKNGGKVLRLTRAPFANTDTAVSETALDDYDGFDAVLDNSRMNISAQCKEVSQILLEWGFIPDVKEE